MKTIGAYEAKTHFSRLLDEVSEGETITITKHGKPVAKMVPAEEVSGAELDRLMQEWREYRKRNNITLGGLSIREMIDEGRM